MTTITFDTHLFVRKLRETGITEPQAEVIADAIKEAQSCLDVASKADLELLRADLKRDIAETKAELIRWVVGAGFLQTTLIAALLLKMMK